MALNVPALAESLGIQMMAAGSVNAQEVLDFTLEYESDLLVCVKWPQLIRKPRLETLSLHRIQNGGRGGEERAFERAR